MTNLLLFLVIVALLVIALQPAHRRQDLNSARPGEDVGPTSDRARVDAERRVMDQLGGRLQRVGDLWASAGTAVPLHRARIDVTDPGESRPEHTQRAA